MIKKWNTELLAGEGADLYVMYDLPKQEYIEKGILADLSDVILPFVRRGEFLPYVVSNYRENEKIFTIAPTTQFPIIYGNKEVIESMQSFESLYSYIKDHSKEKIFPDVTTKNIIKMLFEIYQDEIVKEQVDEEAYDKCIQIMDQMKLFQNAQESNQLASTAYGNPDYDLSFEFPEYTIDPNDTKTSITQLVPGEDAMFTHFRLATAITTVLKVQVLE